MEEIISSLGCFCTLNTVLLIKLFFACMFIGICVQLCRSKEEFTGKSNVHVIFDEHLRAGNFVHA